MRSGVENRPDFIIIGAMKCATSTMHDQLNIHDSFFMSSLKEPNFFSDDEVYSKGIQWYEKLFEKAKAGQLKGESSTHYTKLPRYPATLERLAALCPDIKCIYMMRHPVDRLISHYVHEWTQGVISCDIDKAVTRHPELLEYGRYNMQIEPYLKRFGPSSVLPIFAERLRENPVQELQAVFKFMGLNKEPVWHDEIRSNVSAERLRICAWRDALVNNQILQFIRKKFIPKSFRMFIKNFWTMRERPELSPKVLSQIEDVFDQDLKELGFKLALDLNCGNYKHQVLAQESIQWVR